MSILSWTELRARVKAAFMDAWQTLNNKTIKDGNTMKQKSAIVAECPLWDRQVVGLIPSYNNGPRRLHACHSASTVGPGVLQHQMIPERGTSDAHLCLRGWWVKRGEQISPVTIGATLNATVILTRMWDKVTLRWERSPFLLSYI